MQEQLDTHTKALRKAIKLVDAAIDAAGKAADDLCTAGNLEASADLREIEGDLRIGAGHLTVAYGKGRRLAIDAGGGMITPMSGGK